MGELLTRDGSGTTGITALRRDWVVVLSVSISFVVLVSAATAPTSIRKTTLAADRYDEHRGQQTLELLREYCVEGCDEPVTIHGITYRIVDIGMRMPQPHGLYRTQGAPEWYVINQDYSCQKYELARLSERRTAAVR